MGQAIAHRNGYRVSEPAVHFLTESGPQQHLGKGLAGRAFAGMAMASSSEVTRRPDLMRRRRRRWASC
jgi:hypothetical protein